MKKSILIVEDETILAQDLKADLENAGYAVCGIAHSGQQARELIRSTPPDLVLLDIVLTGNDSGIDLARDLKKADIPFVYLSANSDQGTFRLAKATEPYGFLVKPYRHRELVMMLEIALDRHRQNAASALAAQERLEQALNALQHPQ